MDEIDAAKKEVGNAWSDLKSEVKKGVNEEVSDRDKQDLRKSMDELKAATEALKNFGN